NKKDVIRLLEDIALHLELKAENPFRVSAYRKAAQGLEQDVRSLKEIDDFTKIKGIGKGTKDVIVEFVETGRSTVLEELQQEVPQGLIPLLKLPGLGGKRLATVYQELGVTDRTTLKEACENGSLKTVKGLGEKSAQNILKALERESSRPERMPVNNILKRSGLVDTFLDQIGDINRYNLVGCVSRLIETAIVVDLMIATGNRQVASELITQMSLVTDTMDNGKTKVSLIINHDNEVN